LADYIRDIRALVGNTKIIMVACGALVLALFATIVAIVKQGFKGLLCHQIKTGGVQGD
jgi:hypothetical protein